MNRESLRQARGVLPYPSKDAVMGQPTATGQFIFIVLRPDLTEDELREFLKTVQEATEALRAATSTVAARVATVATGFSGSFFGPAGIPRFPSISSTPHGLGTPPAVDGSAPLGADVCCYVVSTSEGVAARFLSAVGTHPAVANLAVERGYQRVDQTEPFGYRDGVRNVRKADRPDVVYIDQGTLPEEPWWAHDGTYLAYLKIAQQPEAMAALPPTEQDAAIGRTRLGHRLDEAKQTGKLDPAHEGEFTTDVPPADSHVRKTGPRGASHDTVQIFRRGLPFYEVGTDGKLHVGLHFASFQASLDAFDVILNRWMTNPMFPIGGPGQPDRLLTRGLISLSKHAFFFVPPDTDNFIGEAMLDSAPKTGPKPKTGRVAVRKKLLDGATQGPHRGELAGFTFRLVDPVSGAQLGDTFTTDGKGHALSADVPLDTPLSLEETGAPAGIPLTAAVPLTLTSAREVVQVTNTVPGGSPY